MHIVSRRNMLALPVERLVGNSHNNHHHSSSRSRLSLSPDSVTSDSSISGESRDSRSPNANSHECHKGHKKIHGHVDNNSMTSPIVSPPPRPSSRETNYSPPPNCKMHHISINTSNSQSVSNSNSNKNSNLVISSSELSDSNEHNNEDNDNQADYHIQTEKETNGSRIKGPYYRHNLLHENSNNTNSSSGSKSPKPNKNIKSIERTCCNSPVAIATTEVSLRAEGETRNSKPMNNSIANSSSTIVKSEVDTDDRFRKEPSVPSTIPVVRDTTEPIHIDIEEGNHHNNNNSKPRRSDKFNEEMSANSNNKNSTKEEEDYEVQVDDNEENYEDYRNTNNRVTTKVNNSWTSGPLSNSCGKRDHRAQRINDDNERTEGTNNSSLDNEDHRHYPNHNHNHQISNHYHNNSDNNSLLGRPPSRPSSSTSSTSPNCLSKNIKHKQERQQLSHHSNNISNNNFQKFSIADILRPDFGINNSNTATLIQGNKLIPTRVNGQVFNPFFNITSSESRFHNNQKWNSNSSQNFIAKAELPSPSPSSSSVLSLKTKPRDGSVSSTDGHRPYRPSSVHCHSEDSNSSSISRLREEVVDDTKVNPPVPKGPLVWPAWVYCTRYSDRPSSGPRSRRIRKNPKDVPEEKRPRTAFTGEQLARLKQEFDENRYLTEKRRQDLARDLKLHENQIKIWFQNKRAKLKKSTGTKNGLAQQLMAQGLYNHSTVPIDEDDEMEMEMGSMGMGMGMHMM